MTATTLSEAQQLKNINNKILNNKLNITKYLHTPGTPDDNINDDVTNTESVGNCQNVCNENEKLS